MSKVYFLDTGMRNCLLNDFNPFALRLDKGELWENTVFRLLVDEYGADEIRFWRTSSGNEIDFVLNGIQEPGAIEVKWDLKQTSRNKYKKFCENYPGIPLRFMWMAPFDENFFRRISVI